MPAKKQLSVNVSSLKKQIGENIEYIRHQKKKSIKEIASFLNLTHTAYRNIERGISEVSVIKIFQIALLLNVNAADILDIETTKHRNASLTTTLFPQSDKNEAIKQHKEEIAFLRKQLEMVVHKL
ncbi:helix-turn-helix domain-containing protein [Ferruginibacter albus]|uniref:helix-turn-helix domain-containing protein n=1 Tax=Ferruginibacter albus TaxID=2875540 RepID=UPI001CC736DE|nr:helix-turn-helix transcriptional regulator [Ferruginibacter albus]UAY53233.1 helix-turn-helix domain-containing protein [Ferruginibacter albus]